MKPQNVIGIEFKRLSPLAKIPGYATAQSAGMDLHAANPEPIIIAPGERVLIPLGFAMALPSQFEAQIRSRSGLALKHGIMVLNSPGTIDADYRGEVGVILYNTDHANFFTVHSGDRIAQMIIARHFTAFTVEVPELSKTARADSGFGSTGI